MEIREKLVPRFFPVGLLAGDWAFRRSFNNKINMAEGNRLCETSEQNVLINTYSITLT